MEENFIPRKFQEEKMLLFNKNEFILFVFIAGIGMILGHILLGVICGILFIKFMKKINKTGRHAFLIGFVYWNFPPSFIRFRKTPPSYMQTFIK
jgi:type IV conjugative transfer system protein TraL